MKLRWTLIVTCLVVSSVSVIFSVTSYIALHRVRHVQHRAQELLTELYRMEPNGVDEATVEALAKRFQEFSDFDGKCTADCEVHFVFENSPLWRLRLADKVQLRVYIALKAGRLWLLTANLTRGRNTLASVSENPQLNEQSQLMRKIRFYRIDNTIFANAPSSLRAQVYNLDLSPLASIGGSDEMPALQ